MTSGGGSSGYDSLNRLAGAQATSGPYQGLQAAWSYDSFGNRTAESFGGNTSTVTAPIPGNTSFGYSGSNQINSVAGGSPPSYDAAGNVTCDSYNATSTPPQCLGPNQYLYHAEGRECAVENLLNGGAMTGYLYDAEGNRVAKGTITSWSCNTATNGFTMSSSSILGPGNEQLTELSWSGGTPQWAYTNVFAGGRVIGAYSPNPNPDAGSNNVPLDQLNFYLTDWLGTRRVMTDSNGIVQATCLSLPYGNGETCTATPSEQLYATLDRDTESGLDHAMFRQYNFMTGRWISPDPYFGSIDASNPQTFNRYAYVGNMPMTYTDPSGLSQCAPTNGGDFCIQTDPNSNCDLDCEFAKIVIQVITLGIENLFHHPQLKASLKPRPIAPNTGTIKPLSRWECAAMIANDEYSIAAHTSGSLPWNPVVQATLGNSISGLVDLWNSPSMGEGLKNLATGGVNPGLPGPSYGGGAAGVATDLTIKGLMTNAGPAAAEAASAGFGELKLLYDLETFGHAFVADCR